MSKAIHVCLRVGNGSTQELGLSLTVSEGSNQVTGLAFLPQGDNYLEFTCTGRASIVQWKGEDVIHLTLAGQTIIQTGGTLYVDGLLSPGYDKGVANWAYIPETGKKQGAKRQEVSRVTCPGS